MSLKSTTIKQDARIHKFRIFIGTSIVVFGLLLALLIFQSSKPQVDTPVKNFTSTLITSEPLEITKAQKPKITMVSNDTMNAVESYPANFLFILDASRSMWGLTENGKKKIMVAKEALTETIDVLPIESKVGIIACGHQEKDKCDDIEMLMSFETEDRKALLEKLQFIKPQGRTPITGSLEMAGQQLDALEGKATVVLLSDGKETCIGDPCEMVRTLKEKGIEVIVNVVALDVEKEDEQQLRCIAEAGGGVYYNVKDKDQMKNALVSIKLNNPEKKAPIEELWFKEFELGSFDGVSTEDKSIAVDASGNVYISGSFRKQVDFDHGVEEHILTAKGILDIFVQKLDSSGNLIWVKQMGGKGDDMAKSITVDASNNVYVTGYFRNQADFDPGPEEHILTSKGNSDYFIQKLDTAGNLIWVKQMGGKERDNSISIAVDASGNVYVTGYFSVQTDFDPGPKELILTSNGEDDIFIQKLDALGNLLWVKQTGGKGYDTVRSITVDASGNVYVTGSFETTNSAPYTNCEIFIQKLDTSGNLVWVKQMGGKDWDEGFSITTGVSGNVYVTGFFDGQVDFDPGVEEHILTAKGISDIFVQKLDTSGNLIWVKQMGGKGDDMAMSITVDASGEIYVIGHFKEQVDFDPGPEEHILTSKGEHDIFIQKLDTAGNLIWVKQMGGKEWDYSESIATDASGNIFALNKNKYRTESDSIIMESIHKFRQISFEK